MDRTSWKHISNSAQSKTEPMEPMLKDMELRLQSMVTQKMEKHHPYWSRRGLTLAAPRETPTNGSRDSPMRRRCPSGLSTTLFPMRVARGAVSLSEQSRHLVRTCQGRLAMQTLTKH